MTLFQITQSNLFYITAKPEVTKTQAEHLTHSSGQQTQSVENTTKSPKNTSLFTFCLFTTDRREIVERGRGMEEGRRLREKEREKGEGRGRELSHRTDR